MQQHIEGVDLVAAPGKQIARSCRALLALSALRQPGRHASRRDPLARIQVDPFFANQHVELYNRHPDISETHDLAPERPDLATKLKQMLNE